MKTLQAGQRCESSIGLYYYGARWSPGRTPGTGDPMLGRFVQADNIIPNAMNSQAFDRYAYVLNNPIRYTDPTGYKTTDECGPDNINCGGLTDPVVPTISEDPVALNEEGNEIWQIYVDFRDTPGWWNNNTRGTLTIEQFLGMYILFESSKDITSVP